MTDENLEKKAKSSRWQGFAYGLLAGVVGTAIGGSFVAARSYVVGTDEAYQRGKEAGIAEAQEQAPKIDVDVRNVPTRDVFARIGNYSFWAGNCKTLNEGMYFSKSDGEYHIYDLDGIFNEGVKEFRVYHDGLVDFVQLPDGNALLRENDYEANKALFDEADALLNQIREQYSEQ